MEYRQKNDTLTGLLNEYQGLILENSELKKELSVNSLNVKNLQNDLKIKDIEINEAKGILAQSNKKYTEKFEFLEQKATIDILNITAKLDLEKERALIATEKEYQNKLQISNEQYNTKVKELLDQLTIKN